MNYCNGIKYGNWRFFDFINELMGLRKCKGLYEDFDMSGF